MSDGTESNSSVGGLFGYKTRIGTTIHLAILGIVTILSQIGVITIDPIIHNGLILFMGGQMLVFAAVLMSSSFRGGNPRVRCQNCDSPMAPKSYTCKICNSSFTFGDSK